MALNLHTAKTYNVKYGPTLIAGWDSEESLRRIFNIFGVEVCGCDSSYEYEVFRDELIELKGALEQRSDRFTDNERELSRELSVMQISIDEFIEILRQLITTSDQENEYVLLSWY